MSLTPNAIVTHLQTYLPTYFDKFSTEISGTASVTGTTVTVSSVDHGLSAGNKFIVSGGSFENLLVSVTDNGDGSVRFETAQDHDLTEPRLPKDPSTLRLINFGNVWDGTYEIVSVPNRRFFEVDFPNGETTLPTLGTGRLFEERLADIIGIQTVATVIDADNFTFVVQDIPDFPTGDIQNFKAYSTTRIFGAANFDRAQQLYNKKMSDEYALFVIMNGLTVSKDRHTNNDSIMVNTAQNFQKQTNIISFSTLVFIPTKDDIAGNDAQDDAYGNLYRALMTVLYGFSFASDENAISYTTVATGHGPGEYNKAYYIHVYDWERSDVTTYENGFVLQPNVAFRDIDATFKLQNDPEALLKAKINLDEEPLSN